MKNRGDGSDSAEETSTKARAVVEVVAKVAVVTLPWRGCNNNVNRKSLLKEFQRASRQRSCNPVHAEVDHRVPAP